MKRNPEADPVSWETEPQFVGLERLNAAVRAEWMKACAWEGIKPSEAQHMKFVAFSPNNPYMKPGSRYDKLVSILQNHLNNMRYGRHNPALPAAARGDLISLFHLARTAGKTDRHARLVWAAAQYHRQHPEVNALNAYMVVDEATRPYSYRNPNPIENRQYSDFHGNPPSHARRVKMPVPVGPMTAIGRAVRIEYEPYGNSSHKGTRFFHDFGDLGDRKIKERPLLVSDKKGDIFFIPQHEKYPHFSERGILG